MTISSKSKSIWQKLINPLEKLSDRQIATIALLFPFAYFIEFFIRRAPNLPVSQINIFYIWYFLISLRFPQTYRLNISLAAGLFILNMIFQFLEMSAMIAPTVKIGFFILVLLVIQIFILEWLEKKK